MAPTLSALATPGVYVYEIDSFPPSIAQVATAIPVFIGYTQQAVDNAGNSLTNIPFRISSMVEYAKYFGTSPVDLATVVTLNPDNSVYNVGTQPSFQMYNALSMFFYNGGADCYIFSVGLYTDIVSKAGFIPGGTMPSCFDILKKYDEPTLIVIPDAAVMLSTNDFNSLMQQALKHCSDMQSRFTIMDVPVTDGNIDIDNFRSGIGGSYLNYGAVYYPYIQTALPCPSSIQSIDVKMLGSSATQKILDSSVFPAGNIGVTQITNAVHDQTTFVTPVAASIEAYAHLPFPLPAFPGDGTISSISAAYNSIAVVNTADDLKLRIEFIVSTLIGFAALNGSFTDKAAAYSVAVSPTIQDLQLSYIKQGSPTSLSPIESLFFALIQIDISYQDATTTPATLHALGILTQAHALGYLNGLAIPNNANYLSGAIAPNASVYGNPRSQADVIITGTSLLNNVFNKTLAMIASFTNDVSNRINGLDLQLASSLGVYANIKKAISNSGLIMPPSGAMAGVYAATDGSRGVWKAPANVSLANVIKPTVAIDDDMQGGLNIDTNAGKSINAIRNFTGKGTLVWGARTLAGNDQNWRYISVRRTYIMVETSTKNAAFQFVFEPNDIHTWIRIKAMIQNFLFLLWQEGALAGIKPEQAYYVSIGLGQTMTAQDILDGRMIIEIGMAVVRPAEFIVLRFTQLQQQS